MRSSALALETPGVERYVYEIMGTEILVEVYAYGSVFVNGDHVEPFKSSQIDGSRQA